MNVLKKDSNLAHRRPGFVEVGCYESRRFILRGQAEVVADMTELRDAHAEVPHARSMTNFKSLEQGFGIHWNPHGLLADEYLRTLFDIMDVTTENWMHDALQDGTVNVACECLLAAMHRQIGKPPERLEEFLKADWNDPVAVRHKMRGLYHLFDRSARDHIDLTNMKVKCLASELLWLCAILRHYVCAGK